MGAERKNSSIMKIFLLILFTFTWTSSKCQQSIPTKLIQFEYHNKLNKFYVCTREENIQYKDSLTYVWYAEEFGVRKTEGASGGKLLHGSYRQYYSDGNLSQDLNFFLGLEHGVQKEWDSIGVLRHTSVYKKGVLLIDRTYNTEDKTWTEEEFYDKDKIPKLFSIKVFNRMNILIFERITEKKAQFVISKVKKYYESGKLMNEYQVEGLNSYRIGKYTSYYENGQINIAGNFYDGKEFMFMELKNGRWEFYKENGGLIAIDTFRINKEYWENGKLKLVGSEIKQGDEWFKVGVWRESDREGKTLSNKDYDTK